MRLCCDENVRYPIVHLLEQEGHDIVRVQNALEMRFEDSAIVAFCREQDRVLLTNDDDFFDFDDHPGILFLDRQRAPPRSVATAVQRIEKETDDETRTGRVLHVPDGWV